MSTISVVIPVYNDSNTLSRAVDSILNQTYEVCEIIIVDDCSEDHPKAVVDQYDDERITFETHEENRGGSAARNTGIGIASSEYIAFLDADDEWKPTKIQKQITELQSQSDDWVIVHCGVENKRGALNTLGHSLSKFVGVQDRNPTKEGDTDVIREVLRMNLHMSTSSLLIKYETVRAVGGFDERFQRHQDWEFLIRVLTEGKLAYVDEPLVIKHGTGRPSASVHEEAKQLFLEEFSKEIYHLNPDGEHIIHQHKLSLARMYLEDGQFSEGFNRARICSLADLLSVAWSVSLGVYTKLQLSLS